MKTATATRTSEYTELSGTALAFYGKTLSSDDIGIELNLYSNGDEDIISLRNGSTSVWGRDLTSMGMKINKWSHVKVETSNGYWWIWVDGVDKTPQNNTISTFDQFRLRVAATYIVRYNDLRIYSIDEYKFVILVYSEHRQR